MYQVIEQIVLSAIDLILPLVGMRLIFDYTRILLFKD